MRLKLLLAICASMMLKQISAQEAADSVKAVGKGEKRLQEVLIHEAHLSKDAVAKTLDLQYLKREQLLLSQGNTFMNTLEKLPGISAIQTGVGISKPVIRGLSLNRVIVNEYGIKQEGQQWGVDHGLEIDQYNVDRVEVIKGPVSVIYGSDGIGGVINILPPIIPNADTLNVEVISTYKSNNDLLGLSGKVLTQKNGIYFLARATAQSYASYRVPATEFVYNGYTLPIYNNRLKNTGGQELNFSLLTGIKRKWGNSSIYFSNFHQKAGFFVGAFGIPRAYQLNDDGQYRQVGLPYQNINHTKVISNTNLYFNQGKVEADIGWQRNTRQELSPPHAHGYGPAPQGNEALLLYLNTISANIRYLFLGNEKWSSTTGWAFQYQQNERGGYEFLIPSYRTTQTGLFHFVEYKSSNSLLFNAGVRADYGVQHAEASYVLRYDSTGAETGRNLRSPDIDRTYFNVSGSLGSSWQVAKHWKAKMNIGSAYRMPTMAELTANGVHHGTFRHEMGDAQLKAEQGYMLDLSLNYQSSNYHVHITPFVNYFSNYIYLSPSARFSPLPDAGQVYRYTGAAALFAGSEANIEWSLLPELTCHISAEYVWNKNLNTGLALPFTPPLSVLNEWVWLPKLKERNWLQDVSVSLSGQYFAAQNRVDRNEATTDGYFLMHFSVANTVSLGAQKFTIFVQMRNLTNTVYMNNMSRYRMLNLPEQGFNTQIMLRWSF